MSFQTKSILTAIFSVILSADFSLAATAVDDVPPPNRSAGTFPHPHEVEDVTETRPHIGIITGVADTARSYNPALNLGIDAGFQPYVPFSVGFELSHSANDTDSKVETLERTKALFRFSYNFGGSYPLIKSSYVGIAAGAIFENVDQTSNLRAGLSPIIGFDLPVARQWTVGANANYLLVSGPQPDSWGVNGAVKYWY